MKEAKGKRWLVEELIDDPLCKVYRVYFDPNQLEFSIYIIIDAEGFVEFAEPLNFKEPTEK